MHSTRNGLLLLLVLVTVVVAVPLSSALAHAVKSPVVSGPVTVGAERPRIGPTSGEPDVGQTPKPPKGSGSIQELPNPEVTPVDWPGSWLRWIVRIWMMRFGAR